MASLFDFSRRIADLKKEKKYTEALNYFKENKTNFAKEKISDNEYIVSDLITCLRHSNHIDAGFQFLNIYKIEINAETKERILSAYGWLLWTKYKAEYFVENDNEQESSFFDEDDDDSLVNLNTHHDKNELIEKIEEILPLLFKVNNSFQQSLISNLVSIVLKSEKKKPSPNWKLVNEFCNSINPNLLSTICSTIQVKRKNQIKDMELASDLENWYAYKTKALSKLSEWQECFEKSKEALEKLDSFHYSNDIWFSRRIALSKKNLGNTEDTISELESILRKKREWFIQKELAELYLEKEDYNHAFKYAIAAINNFGHIEFKIDLLFLLGKIHNKKGENELAFKHFSLSKLIRQSEEWKIPLKLLEELSKFSYDEITIQELQNLKYDLKNYWNNNGNNSQQKTTIDANDLHQGKVIKILHDNERGKDGFLKFNELELYFSLSASYHLTSKVIIGSNVEFKIIPAQDGKKEQTRIIKLINSKFTNS
jgi:CMP-2-keto-3-deoxyoctulosonic acid synthetase